MNHSVLSHSFFLKSSYAMSDQEPTYIPVLTFPIKNPHYITLCNEGFFVFITIKAGLFILFICFLCRFIRSFFGIFIQGFIRFFLYVFISLSSWFLFILR